MRLAGADINEAAIAFGTAKLAEEGLSADMQKSSLYELDHIADGSFDVVFSFTVLMHIPPDGIETVLRHMDRIARKAVVIYELHTTYPWEQKYYDSLMYPDRWCRDYAALLERLIGIKDVLTLAVPYAMASEGWSRAHEKVDANQIVVASKTGRAPAIKLG